VKPFIQSVTDGKNVSILAYGQTGAGKTFTMEGPNLSLSKEIEFNSGILPRSIYFIFQEMERRNLEGSQILLELACMEIYNDDLFDLLAEEKDPMTMPTKSKLSIVFNGKEVIIQNLTWKKISNPPELFSLISKASLRRSTDKTLWNDRYSLCILI